MKKLRSLSPVLVLGSLVLLPACTALYGKNPNGSAPPPAYATKPAFSPSLIQQVQSALQQQGIYRGTVDGIWGPATQSAVLSYQQSKGLAASGQIDGPTLSALNISNTNEPPATPASLNPRAGSPTDIHGFTQSQAQQDIINQGYTLSGNLTMDATTGWHGMATKDGKTVGVALDPQGNVITTN